MKNNNWAPARRPCTPKKGFKIPFSSIITIIFIIIIIIIIINIIIIIFIFIINL